MKLTGICYALVRFLSEHPIQGCASFILHAILVFLNPLVYYVDLLGDNIPLVAISSTISLLLDTLFLYAPLINEDTKCLVLDNKLKIIALVFRSWGDLRYIFRIAEVLYDYWHIRENKQELASAIASNMMSVLPIPQVAIFYYLPKMRGSNSLKIMKFLNSLIVLQYVVRVYPLFVLCKNWNTWNIGDKGYKLPNWSLIYVNTYGYLLAAYACN
uniref:cyclic nucleotide-gated ion channel 1-like isoform X2 n=1 Tax=Fragaria vesca subsp. vesca TaxID=101020 RepID=UPI0005C8508B|nr:PREDICTED: cyclic nucleotide-gated ion channel 1-like isoform X2 [Fragaria vesca subsp. vesca]